MNPCWDLHNPHPIAWHSGEGPQGPGDGEDSHHTRRGSGLSCARGSQCRCTLGVSSHCHFYWWMGPAPYIYFIFFFLPWKSKSGSWVGREPAKMNSNEPISIEIGSLPCQRLIKPNALNSLQQTRCWRQCPPSCLQEITHNFKIKRIKIEVGVYSYVHTSVPLQGPFLTSWQKSSGTTQRLFSEKREKRTYIFSAPCSFPEW